MEKRRRKKSFKISFQIFILRLGQLKEIATNLKSTLKSYKLPQQCWPAWKASNDPADELLNCLSSVIPWWCFLGNNLRQRISCNSCAKFLGWHLTRVYVLDSNDRKHRRVPREFYFCSKLLTFRKTFNWLADDLKSTALGQRKCSSQVSCRRTFVGNQSTWWSVKLQMFIEWEMSGRYLSMLYRSFTYGDSFITFRSIPACIRPSLHSAKRRICCG